MGYLLYITEDETFIAWGYGEKLDGKISIVALTFPGVETKSPMHYLRAASKALLGFLENKQLSPNTLKSQNLPMTTPNSSSMLESFSSSDSNHFE